MITKFHQSQITATVIKFLQDIFSYPKFTCVIVSFIGRKMKLDIELRDVTRNKLNALKNKDTSFVMGIFHHEHFYLLFVNEVLLLKSYNFKYGFSIIRSLLNLTIADLNVEDLMNFQ